jgi:DegV family protein with EDD domain
MSDLENQILYLNGARFKRAFISGAKRVIARHDHLNKINVFPVSDSDTGTNISVTLSAGLKAVALNEDESLAGVLAAFADGTLDSARGNSGTIFAQFFQGITEAAEPYQDLDTWQFIEVFAAGAKHAYEAVAEPVEGTVLTVLNDVADYLNNLPEISADFDILFTQIVTRANISLKETPEKLKVLKKFGVVDAGAQAMVDFFEGILEFMHQGSIKGLEDEIATILESELDENCAGTEHTEEYTYRFCTECVIVADPEKLINQAELKAQLMPMGDSLVLAGSKRKTKIHMHVNQPAQLFALARRHGKLLNVKSDDMFHQVKDAHTKHSQVAIVADSSMNLPQEILDSLNIHVIPIRIHIGDEAFIDGISITPEKFYQSIATADVVPKTAHPTYGDFKAKYQFLNSHYKAIVSIHIAKVFSNTIGAAELVKRDMPRAKLAIIDSKNTSIGMGLVVQYAGELANAGFSYEDIIERVKVIIPKTKMYALMGDIGYGVRGGRVPKFAKSVADFLKVSPIMEIRLDAKPKIAGLVTNNLDRYVEQFAKKMQKKIDPKKRYRIAVGHANDPVAGQKLLDLMTQNNSNIESSFLTEIGVTIGSHAGPGTIGVALQEYVPIKR